MSRSINGAFHIGALSILLSSGGAMAAAPTSPSEPLFVQCGRLDFDPLPARLAARASREGRSAILRTKQGLMESAKIVPGILAFDFRSNGWSTPPALATAGQEERFCPSGERL